MKKGYLIFALLLILLFSVCISSPRTKGIYQPTFRSSVDIWVSWEYDPDNFFRYIPAIVNGTAYVGFYEWKTGRYIDIDPPLPDLEPYKMNLIGPAAQGPNNLIAYSLYSYDVHVVANLETNEVISIIPAGSPIAFAPDGEHIAVGRDDELFKVDFISGEETSIFKVQDIEWSKLFSKNGIQKVTWSPDEENLAIVTIGVSSQNDVEYLVGIYHLDNGESTLIEGYTEEIERPTWSPDGNLVSYMYEDTLKIYDVENQCEVISFPYEGLERAFWSPQGNVIAIIEEDVDLYFLDIEQVFGKPYDELECP